MTEHRRPTRLNTRIMVKIKKDPVYKATHQHGYVTLSKDLFPVSSGMLPTQAKKKKKVKAHRNTQQAQNLGNYAVPHFI